jgi:DTW domain-containing protein YfiP
MECTRCLKPQDLCVCDDISIFNSELHVLILQHPQEPDKKLGSAHIAHLSLPNSTLKTGLSWANLSKALGRPAESSRWAVLYLGSGVKNPGAKLEAGLHFVDKKGERLASDKVRAIKQTLEGIIVIDGTWSQAKALWWRNAWFLKLKRAVLVPAEKSLYRELRREPRAECLSTIETIAETLTALGEKKEIGHGLKSLFGKLLEKERVRIKAQRNQAREAKPIKADSV